MFRRSVPAAFAAGLLCASTVVAQPAPQDEAVVVSASRSEQRLRDAIPHTTVITRKDIRDAQVTDLPALLRREAGFEFTQNGGIGTNTGIFMRGGRGAQALILIDGVRVQDGGFGTTAIQHLMLDQVERIEIVRGNVSSLYGSGAIGGVVQVFTRRGSGKPAPRAEAMLGSYGTNRLSGGIGGQHGETRFDLSVTRFETRGFTAIDPALAPNANPEADGYRNTSVGGSLSHRLSAAHEVGGSFLSARGRVDFDSAFATRTSVHDSAQDLGMGRVYWEARPGDRWTSRLTLSEGRDYRTDRLNGAFNDRSNTRSRQLTWDNQVRIAPAHEASVGIEQLRQRVVVAGTTNIDRGRDASSLRAGYLGRVGAHSLQVNLRGEDYSDFGRANTHFVGYGFDLTPAWRVTASAGTAFRTPTFQDLYGFGGDPALRPERSRTHEVGLQWAVDGHRVRVVAFDTEFQDAITFSANRSRNVRKARVTGLESSYAGQLLGFDLRASFTAQDPVEQEPNAVELQAIRRAKRFGSLSAYRSFGPWRAGGDLIGSADRRDTHIVSGASLREAGYTRLDLVARYQFDKALYAAVRLENALDEQYRVVHGYNMPGRSLYVSLGWQP